MYDTSRVSFSGGVGGALANGGAVYGIVHANAEFLDQVSDHDPVLLTLSGIPAPVPEPATVLTMLAGLGRLLRKRSVHSIRRAR